ncbi:MAG: FapA family protein [Fibrobacterales bacterium]
MRQIDLVINSEGTKVVCKSVAPSTTVVDFLDRLQDLQVREGFSKDSLQSIIERVDIGGVAEHDVIVAVVPSIQVTLAITDVVFSPDEVTQLGNELRRVYKSLTSDDGKKSADFVYFVTAQTPIITIGKSRKNVYGMDVMVDLDSDFLQINSEAFSVDELSDVYQLVAKREGYVGMNDRLQLDIFEPTLINDTETEMHFYFHPAEFGQQKIIQSFFNQVEDGVSTMDEAEVRELLQEGFSKKILCRKRREPVVGQNGRIVVHYIPPRERGTESELQVDHKAWSQFDMVKMGEIICEKLPVIDGVSGVDVMGVVIPVDPVIDCDFTPGENILIEEREKSTLYRAEKDGIVSIQEHGCSINTNLQVDEVSQETGNITFDHSVVIKKDVKEGFSISTKEDCIIGGNVENGAIIECGGNLIVKRGIFGDQTVVKVKGDAEIGFIQESTVSVDKNILVDGFIYHAKIFAGENIEVSGKKIVGDNKGSVIGGVLNAFHSITLHSVGSHSTKTELFAGVNMENLRNMYNLRERVKFCDAQVDKFKMLRGLDLMSKEATAKVAQMDTPSKQLVKTALENIKKIVAKKKEIQKVMSVIEEQVFHPQSDTCEIEIKNHIIPDVYLRVSNGQTVLKGKDKGRNYVNVNGQIIARTSIEKK